MSYQAYPLPQKLPPNSFQHNLPLLRKKFEYELKVASRSAHFSLSITRQHLGLKLTFAIVNIFKRTSEETSGIANQNPLIQWQHRLQIDLSPLWNEQR